MKPMLSIVYVYYNTPDEIRKSIKSLERTLQAISYEIIIVDNASVKSLHPNIYQLSNINIIRNKKNYGYGKGLNCGSRAAQGKYLLLVNPDVEFTENSIKYLLDKLESNSKIGIIGPQLMDGEGKILQSISGMPYLPEALFIFSFISKIWPNNPFSSKYNNIDLDRNREQNVDVVGGACLMISRKLFIKAGGLDEDFFMYFEEADFCFRVRKMGYKVLYLPKAKVVHLIGRSTQDKEWIEKTFEQSRFIFFKKYHGLVLAVLAELVLRFIKPINLLLMLALALSIFLNFYRISERMIFIGDQGWFYISARDMILTGKIPLVGITSSHTWLHQGPLWTYLLAFVLWAFNYNPLSGAYFTVFLNIFTVFLVYKLGKKMFSKRVGLIAALLYATSPLVIVNSHMPYHTSPIPLLVLGLIYSIYRWVKGNAYFLPLTIFILALLYNFELATQVIWVTILIIFILGFIKKKKWAINILNKEIWFLTISLFILPMLPIIIYDVNHNFAQTLKFFAWIPYRAISQLAESQESLVSMINFFLINYQQLIFASNYIVSFLILLLSIGYFAYHLFKGIAMERFFSPIGILMIFIATLLIGFFINNSASSAYLPLFFPSVIIATAWIFDKLMKKKHLFIPVLISIFLIAASNTLFILDTSRNKSTHGYSFSQRLNLVKTILKEANGKDYGIKGNGPGSQFDSFTMNYEYLAWWLGKPPSKNSIKNIFIISENNTGISVEKKH